MFSSNITELLERYLQYCTLFKDYSKITLSGYRSTLKVFLKDTGVQEIQELNQKLLEEWFFQGRLKRKWGSVTFRSYHKNINCFFKWLIKEGVLKENYVEKMEKPRLESKLPRTLSFNEARLVLDAAFHMHYATSSKSTETAPPSASCF